MKRRAEFVFVVLVYKNANDLDEFFQSVQAHCEQYRVVVVNAYYDADSEKTIKTIAKKYGADFITVTNEGYSYGNNQGIRYAMQTYEFHWLIVCNPDIALRKWNPSSLQSQNMVYGPVIKTLSGKHQNPSMVCALPIFEWIAYKGYLYGVPLLDYILFLLNRAIREFALFVFFRRTAQEMKVYSVHGSFILFSYQFLRKTPAPFLDTMFLFNEERFLAWNLKRNGQFAVVTKEIEILHKEDGSINSANVKGKEARWNQESFLTYYETVHSTVNRRSS